MKSLRFIISAVLITSLSCNATNWPFNITATGCVATTAIIGYQTLKNYQALVPLHEKVQSEHTLLGDSTPQEGSFYRWKRDIWPTARFMQQDRENVKRAFSAAFVNRELVVYAIDGSIIVQPTWLDIKAAINNEKGELRQDLLYLEQHFLTSFLNYGFIYDYKAACKQAGVDPYANMAWTQAQEERVEALVKEIYNKKSWLLFGFNYSLAASIYWRLFKFFKRLEVLEGIVSELAVGYDAVYVRPQGNPLTVVLK